MEAPCSLTDARIRQPRSRRIGASIATGTTLESRLPAAFAHTRAALRTRSVVSIVTVIALSVTGCTSSPPHHDTGNTSAASTLHAKADAVTVAADGAATASTGGVRVTLPAGAAQAGARLIVHATPAPSVAGLEPLSSAVKVTLTAGQLEKPAKVIFPAPSTQKLGGRIPVVVWQDGSGGWRWLPSRFEPADGIVRASAPHFSLGFLAGIDPTKWAKDRLSDATDYLSGRSGVVQPHCPDENGARSRVQIASDQGDTVKWCVGRQNGQTIIKVANNQRAYSQILYPQGWTANVSDGVSLEAVKRLIGSAADQFAAPQGYAVRLLSGGDTLTITAPDGATGTVEAEMSLTTWLLSAISFGLDVGKAVFESAGLLAGQSTTVSERVFGFSANRTPDEAYLEAWKECGKAVSGELTDKPINPVSGAAARAVLKAAWTCIPAFMKADWTDVGLNFLGAGVVVSAAGVVIGAILDALNLLTSGVRYIWDQFASFGGNSDPVYDIQLAPLVPLLQNALPPFETGDRSVLALTELLIRLHAISASDRSCTQVDVYGARVGLGDFDLTVDHIPNGICGNFFAKFYEIRNEHVERSANECDCPTQSRAWNTLTAPYAHRSPQELHMGGRGFLVRGPLAG